MSSQPKVPGLVIAALSLLGPGSIIAQSTTTAQPSGEKVTVAGCVQRAQRNGSVGGTIVGTTPAPNTADVEANSSEIVDAFLLTQARSVVAGTADSPGSSSNPTASSRADSARAGSTAGTSGRVEPTTFGLVGREAEIERHQGARMQVTGTLIPPASSGLGTGGAATASGAKRLQVESFKILADKCTGN